MSSQLRDHHNFFYLHSMRLAVQQGKSFTCVPLKLTFKSINNTLAKNVISTQETHIQLSLELNQRIR